MSEKSAEALKTIGEVAKELNLIELETGKAKTGAQCIEQINISVAGISKGNYPSENRYGKMEMRGAGAATKGRMTSGKMG